MPHERLFRFVTATKPEKVSCGTFFSVCFHHFSCTANILFLTVLCRKNHKNKLNNKTRDDLPMRINVVFDAYDFFFLLMNDESPVKMIMC